jgi:shikimate kinase
METKKKTNIYLVGYMGTGKTTIGKLLAEKLSRSFIDMDGFIENRYHKTVSSIFEEKSEAGFREIEHRTLQEISSFENVVVSTGGGLPCFFDNMDLMNRTGITIYLKASVDELVGRLSFDKQKRPLIKGKNAEDLRDFVKTNLEKRESFYSQAAFIFDIPRCSSKKEISQWVEELIGTSQLL